MRATFALGLALAALAGDAAARDRPAPEAARACPRHGPGFVEVPGTTTCIRIGGRVTAEAGAASRRVRREDISGIGASARLSADARTDTPYGPVRTFVRLRAGSGGTRP